MERITPEKNELTPVETFTTPLGISRTTFWRWRKRGWVKTINIAGRQYLSQIEIARFRERAEAGQFARTSSIN